MHNEFKLFEPKIIITKDLKLFPPINQWKLTLVKCYNTQVMEWRWNENLKTNHPTNGNDNQFVYHHCLQERTLGGERNDNYNIL